MVSVSLGHYLSLCVAIFFIGLYGLLSNRRQILALFLSAEVAFVAGLLMFLVFSNYHHNLKGQVFALVFLGVMIAKTVIGIALIINLYKRRHVSFIALERKDELS